MMGAKRRPLQWLEVASAEEIGEALLAVDRVKAVKVSAYLASRIGPEAENLIDGIRDNLETDPIGALGNALIGMSGAKR
jgi:hypothetical protein